MLRNNQMSRIEEWRGDRRKFLKDWGAAAGVTVAGLALGSSAGAQQEYKVHLPLVPNEKPELPGGDPEVVAEGFMDELVIGGLNKPTAMAIHHTGLTAVAEKDGLIWTYPDYRNPDEKVLTADLSPQVMSGGDFGLVGIDGDPDPDRPFIYALYQVDAPPDQEPPVYHDQVGDNTITYGRLERITVGADNVATERKVLVTGWPTQGWTHGVGSVRVDPQGKLWVSAGDGTQPRFEIGQTPGIPGYPIGEGGALRAQNLQTLSGKIIRVDADTGLPPSDNPRYHDTTNVAEQMTLASGLRNPLRFDAEGDGTPPHTRFFVADVGQARKEEVTVAEAGAKPNLGWPCYEGDEVQVEYGNADLEICNKLFAEGGVTNPLYVESHEPGQPSAISAIAHYKGGVLPAEYEGALFIGNYGTRTIKAIMRDGEGNLNPHDVRTIVENVVPVDMRQLPDGRLAYVDYRGQVRALNIQVGPNIQQEQAPAQPQPTGWGRFFRGNGNFYNR